MTDISTLGAQNQITNALASRGAAQAQTASDRLENLAQNLTPERLNQIENAAKEFEAVFLSQVFAHLFEGVGSDPLFGGGSAEETFQDFLIEEYGKQVADRGGIGIADHVKAQLIELQSATQNTQ